MRVLLVDDDKSTLTLLGLHLARAGHEVYGALDADAAEARLEERDYDWLVVDGQIGSDDGFSLAARAKALHPSLRVAMVSGFYEPGDVGESPVERLFPKPVDTDALLAHLHSAPPS